MSTGVLGAFLVDKTGRLLGSLRREELWTVDEDLVAGQLDIIVQFLNSSLSLSEGKWLSRITTRGLTLAFERGAYCYLVVVLRGELLPSLGPAMRAVLRDFETLNRAVLPHWGGRIAEIRSSEELLRQIVG